jgi:hypothetical protein
MADGPVTVCIRDTTVLGDTTLDLIGGGFSGDSNVTIGNSRFQGGGAAPAFRLQNADGVDIVQVDGQSTFGTGTFWAGLAVRIRHGDGGSRTTFTGDTVVYGALGIENGSNLPGTMDIATFNQAEVFGEVRVFQGDGPSLTTVLNSELGTHLISGGPLTIRNDAGVDAVRIEDSEIPWGVVINQDDAAGGASVWGSSTDIVRSEIGMHPIPPAVAMALAGDNGADTVDVRDTNFGGTVVIDLFDGNNSVAFNPSSMAALSLTTGVGNDTVRIDGTTIPVSVGIALSDGVDRVEVVNAAVLPDPLYGALAIDGGLGVDQFELDSDVDPDILVGLTSFEVVTLNP